MAGSLNPEKHTESGGGFGEGIQRVANARFVRHDLGGKSPMKMFLAVNMIAKENGKERTQYYSAGDLSMFTPSADGKSYEPVAGATLKSGKPAPTTIYKSSNASKLLESLVKANFPAERFDAGDVSVIEGGEYLFEEKTFQFKGDDGTTKNTKVLLVTKVITLPGGAAASNGVAPKAVATVKAIVAANGNRLETARLSGEIFKSLMTDPQRNDVIAAVTPAFLAQTGQPWIYDAQAGLIIGQ